MLDWHESFANACQEDNDKVILYDCHVHTSFSSDSKTEPEDQIIKAVGLGMKGICFTDHMDYEIPTYERSGMSFVFDQDSYFEKISALKQKYRDRIEILTGIEIGLRNEAECSDRINEKYSRLLEGYPFDFVIGSTHCLEFTDPYYSSPYWDDKDAYNGLRIYFEAVRENITGFGGFDTLGHLDYLIRYIPGERLVKKLPDGSSKPAGIDEIYDPRDYHDIIEEILKILIDQGKALEVNSSGLKYGLGHPHPKCDILKRYRELGGELITVGSDGHRPEHICYGFDRTCEMLVSLGFKYQCVYRKRRPEMVPI